MKTASIALLAVIFFAGTAYAQHHDTTHQTPGAASRQEGVAARGSQVMPFSLDRSNHVFEPRRDGGIQTVVSKDNDPGQVALIREHLEDEAAAFATGDYGSPTSIHGADMPGLNELTRSAGRVQITYEPIERGGRIRFVSAEPQLVEAIHKWFDAQVSDHGAHASAP